MARSIGNAHARRTALEKQLASKRELLDIIEVQLAGFPSGSEPPEKVRQRRQLEGEIQELEDQIDALPVEESGKEHPAEGGRERKPPAKSGWRGQFHVDRTAELTLLDQILDPQARQRILLLQAPSGFGKSLLLDQYQDRLLDRQIPHARVDLSTPGFSVVDFLRYLCDEWGRANFARFLEVLAQFVAGASPAERKERLEKLTDVWVQDCQAWLPSHPQAVIIVDAYNVEAAAERSATVDPELRAWLETVLLVQVRRTPGLRLVLAGQQTPAPHGAWAHCCLPPHTLGPISNPDDWMEWVREVGWKVSHEVVSAFCHSTHGHPLQMAMLLRGLAGWEGLA